jgi:O-methyltransferase involved in polyketide biosynthesis
LKIALKEEMETLLIPLYGRAEMSKKGLFKDTDAEDAVAQIDYNFSNLEIKEKTQIMLSIRGKLIDDSTKDFLKGHPDSTVLYLGCGLDFRAKRLGFPAELWYDVDFPEVINIKQQLYAPTKGYRYLASSVTNWEWMDNVQYNNKPVLVIAEGLLMYLNEQDIQTLLLKLRDKFQNVTMIFDAYSTLTANHAKDHPSLKKTGATIQWGTDTPQTIEVFGDGIKHLKTLYFTDDTATSSLPKRYRSMFWFAGKFKTAREAHRIFVMNLSSR